MSTGLSVVDVKSGQIARAGDQRASDAAGWSPDGSRIAYWGVRGQTGQRDLWTVAADGSDAANGGVSVTDDAALDWNPTWSPDGRYLYFSSTRGGPMNLWRVRIDERSGRVLGEPEPVTTPSTWSGDLSFSRDGTRLAFASLDFRSTLAARAVRPGARGGGRAAGADPEGHTRRSATTSCRPTASGSRSPRPACPKISSSRASTARSTAG